MTCEARVMALALASSAGAERLGRGLSSNISNCISMTYVSEIRFFEERLDVNGRYATFSPVSERSTTRVQDFPVVVFITERPERL
jgi:hypothetical protein